MRGTLERGCNLRRLAAALPADHDDDHGGDAGSPATVLTAFQQVEDDLATLHVIEQQVQVQEQTVKSANLAVQLTLNQYKAGNVAYTSVITAQTVALADAQTPSTSARPD